MKTKIKHLAVFVLLTVLFASCASNQLQCAAYAYAEPKNKNIEKFTKSHTLEPVESKGLEEKPKNFQWEDSFIGLNGGKLY